MACRMRKAGKKVPIRWPRYGSGKNSWARPGNDLLSGHRASVDPEHWKAANIITDEKTGRKRITYRNTPSNIHRNLSRAQSSIVVQIRNERVGLNSYLYQRKVFGVINPKCQCGYLSQNIKYMVLACPQWAREGERCFERQKIGHLR